MPDPIRSTNPSPAPSYQDPECVDPLLGGSSSATGQARSEAAQAASLPVAPSKEEAGTSRPEPPKLSPAVQTLVAHNSRSNTAAEFVRNQQEPANTTAERTAQTPLRHAHFETGTTADGSKYLTAGLLYGRDPKSGVTEEYGTVSMQVGAQNEIQLTALRIGMQNDNGDSLSAEALTVQAGAGIHNKDGSTGLNISAGATLVGAEATLDQGGGKSTTAGVAVGKTFEASIGVKDSDHDGKLQVCGRLAVPGIAYNVGGCADLPDPSAWLLSDPQHWLGR